RPRPSAGALRMSALWQAADVAQATGGRAAGAWSVNGISIDSRTVAPGDLFVALHGDRFDGHDYVAPSLAAGAAAAMVDRPIATLDAQAPTVTVYDTMQGLVALGAAGRARSPARIAAVTGS